MPIDPMDNAIMNAMADMAMLRYFPADEFTRASIMRLIRRMATRPEDVAELARRVLAHYNEWPGPLELRGVLCTFAKPADGIEADVTSAGTLESAIEQRYLATHDAAKRREMSPGSLKFLPAAKVLK